MGSPESNLPPGFRFHPTDEELILHYLRKKVASIPLPVSIIAEVDIYKLDPWDLPAKAAFGEKEWYFFSPRDRKYPNGARPNRAAASGYWKATGTDKTIMASAPGGVGQENIGVKKALVFYKGKPPKGVKTNWIMHEYRLVDNNRPIKLKDTSMRLDDWVLCRIYKKSKFTISPTEGGTVVGDQDQAEENNNNLFLKDTVLFSISKSPTPTPPPHQNTLISQKSVSFSNLLDAMDYSMLSSFLSDQNHNHHSNNNPQGIIGFGSSSSSSPPPPSLGFNIGNMDHHHHHNHQQQQQQQHSQINTSIISNNNYMFHQKNNPSLNTTSSVTNNSMENIMVSRPKRQLLSNIDEEEETLLHPSKKYLMSSSSCSFSNNNSNNPQYETNPQWNYLMKQSLLNQQLLLGPHLRFQG